MPNPSNSGDRGQLVNSSSQHATYKKTYPDGSTKTVRYSAKDGPNGTVIATTPPTSAPKKTAAVTNEKVLNGSSQHSVVQKTYADGSTQTIRYSAKDGANGTVLSTTAATKTVAPSKPAGATDKVLAGGSQYAIVERTLPDGSTQKIRFSANDGPTGTLLSSTPPTLPKTNAPTAAPTGQTAPITATTPVVGTTPAVTDAPESSGMLISSGGASGGTAIGSTAPSAPTDTTTRPPVAPTTPAQPGSSSASDLIVYSIDELQANTKMLRETAESVIAVWNDIINTQIGELEKSWAGPDASVYTEKVKAFDPKIKAACQAIELLADTFDKSGNEISETQNQNVNDIELI